MKTILISGTTNGIGRAMAETLYKNGFRLILLNRNRGKAEQIKSGLLEFETNKGSLDLFDVDFSSLISIKNCAEIILKKYSSIDVLINNAGVYCDHAQKTTDGIEMTFGVNYIAPFFLSKLLLPVLQKSPDPRIINISSKAGLYGKIHFKNSLKERHPHGFKGYSASKYVMLLWTRKTAA